MKAATVAASAALLAACAPSVTEEPQNAAPVPTSTATDELGNPVNTYEDITNYNNYYEFTTDKQGVAGLAKDFTVAPWTVEVGGLVNKPKTFGIEDLLKNFTQEERIYRLRCVEAWSMVIPWKDLHWRVCSIWSSQLRMQNMCVLKLCFVPKKCPDKKARSIHGRIRKDCDLTKP